LDAVRDVAVGDIAVADPRHGDDVPGQFAVIERRFPNQHALAVTGDDLVHFTDVPRDQFVHAGHVVLLEIFERLRAFFQDGDVDLVAADVEIGAAFEDVADFADEDVHRWIDRIVGDVHRAEMRRAPDGRARRTDRALAMRIASLWLSVWNWRDDRDPARIGKGNQIFQLLHVVHFGTASPCHPQLAVPSLGNADDGKSQPLSELSVIRK